MTKEELIKAIETVSKNYARLAYGGYLDEHDAIYNEIALAFESLKNELENDN